MNKKRIILMIMILVFVTHISKFDLGMSYALEPVEAKIKEEMEISHPEQYEMNIILDDLDIRKWNCPPYAPDEYDLPVDEPLGRYTADELKKYTDRDVQVKIDYGCGRLWNIEKDKFFQVIRIYEGGEIITISAHVWNNKIPYPNEVSYKTPKK